LNDSEIIGFPEPCADRPRFDLLGQLQQVGEEEITRIVDIAGRLALRFAPGIAVGFLFYQILGRPPDNPECAHYEEQLRKAPSGAAVIAGELLTLRDQRGEPSPETTPAR
jgi:hypothetical protein